MAIDFYTLLREEFGHESAPAKLNSAEFRKLSTDLRNAMVLYALKVNRGNQVKAARLLNLNRNTLRSYMREAGYNTWEMKM